MKLRFDEAEISHWAALYKDMKKDEKVMCLCQQVRTRGWVTLDELQTLAYWKAPRSAGHVRKNDPRYVKEITRFALSAETERARIESLTACHRCTESAGNHEHPHVNAKVRTLDHSS